MDRVGFRPVTRTDLTMLANWLRDARVSQWWRDPATQLAEITADLDNPVMQQWLVLLDGGAVGYAQFYPAHHWGAPHFAGLAPDALAIDCFAGPAGFGHGGVWLDGLAQRLLEQASVLVIDPQPSNLRAIRAYAKAGFAGDVIRPSADGSPARVMTRHR